MSRAKADILTAILGSLGAAGDAAILAPLLFDRPPADDLEGFAPAALALAARRAVAALAAHRVGLPVVAVEEHAAFSLGGTDLRLVTIVNDDMPFLFDSVMAEIAERAVGIAYISHPILDVARDAAGAIARFSAAGPGEAASRNPARVSLIQVAIEPDADPEGGGRLAAALERILRQVHLAVRDFGAMRERVGEAAAAMGDRATSLAGTPQQAMVEESAKLLDWLLADNFIFLGAREFDYVGAAHEEALERRDEEALGILSDPEVRVLSRAGQAVTTTAEIRAFLQAPNPLIVTKANSRALVHRRTYMDYIGVKRYAEDGSFVGELRVVGLFTSSAYTHSILTIPYLRLKAETVIARFGLASNSHSGKALLNVLESYPRDEMFQIDVDLLERFAGIVLDLGERPRVRVLPRVDRFDRFVSVLVFVPRDRYDSRLRERIGQLLAERFDGHISAYYPAFPEGGLTRVHFIVGRKGGTTPVVDAEALEQRIAEMAKAWEDGFIRAIHAAGAAHELLHFTPGLPDSYRDVIAPAEAVKDTQRMALLGEGAALSVDFYRRPGDPEALVRLKIYHLGAAVALSTRVPILENMGFSSVSERTFQVRRPDGQTVHLHDMDLVRQKGGAIPLADDGRSLQQTFAAVSAGQIENDGFNALVLEAGLAYRQANVLRAYARYLRQAGIAYGQDFLAATLLRQPAIAAQLWQVFDASFNPAHAPVPAPATSDNPEDPADPQAVQRRLAEAHGAAKCFDAVIEALDAVDSLDDDRIIRRFLGVILATLRTNFYAVDGTSAEEGSTPTNVSPALAFKLDSSAVEGLPAPVPFREIFVFDARVEGVHLRFGRVARGGLRWSDRSQDYRTEVLGLVKAQQVKNAVIVPVGAKGGFFPKRLGDPASRDTWFEAGRAAYVVFIASLLSVTDNIDGAAILTPDKVKRYDGEDPYFVVAADKGTATFSDTANAIAQANGFWLDDAFASGGSVGYDHKAMGITARGAWEAVKRHFREMDRDIQTTPFTVVGCGDMSGDVFGNGMLLSPETRLLAAFDHRDIFIDPNPDAAASLAERQRLFALPRSSWADYDKALISAGGGVFSRREKLIRLSPEAAAAIGWDRTSGTPAEIINAILKAPADLLWFGGIGTYVRAGSETNADVGDRANDALRVTGAQIRAKVVGEGANLGVTQRGRIEYARHGGRMNTDAIDNSAGVNTSDVEVNIKIALKSAMAEGRLTRPDRNVLLASMTAEVGKLVLANNYEQTLALSLEARRGVSALPLQARFMTVLEEAGLLDRSVELLPTDAGLADLRASGLGLSRPEIAVLLAYSKIVLFDQLIDSPLPDDPYLRDRLFQYFPAPMRQGYAGDIEGHRLAREIVSTVVANLAINTVGPTFVTSVRDATGAAPGDIVAAFVATYDGLGGGALLTGIDRLDGQIHGETQNALYAAASAMLQGVTRWFVQNGELGKGLGTAIAAVQDIAATLRPRLLTLASPRAREEAEERCRQWVDKGVPADLAAEIALLPLLALVPDIAFVSRETDTLLEPALSAYFAITRLFEIGRLEAALQRLEPVDYYEILALERAASQIAGARRRLTARALAEFGGAEDPVAAWAESRQATVGRITQQIAALAGSGDTSVARLTVAAGLLSDLSA
jgi:glutamate dehydrogenase